VTILLTALSLAIFLGAAVCYSAVLFLNAPAAPAAIGPLTPSSRPSRYSGTLLYAGIAMLFFSIGSNCISTRHSPFASEYGTLLVGALATAVTFAIWDRKTRLPAAGGVATLISCMALAGALFKGNAHVATDPLIRNPLVTVHVLAIVAAYALILVAAACAGMYLIQNRQLKAHSKSPIMRLLPPLTRLDTIVFQCVSYAFPLLTLSLVVIPMIFRGQVKEPASAWFVDSRFVSTAVLWFLFSTYLGGRLVIGWRGVRLQVILLVGIALAFAAYALPTASAHRFN
jgi:ABC-type uncharacterized transport system permease subunit